MYIVAIILVQVFLISCSEAPAQPPPTVTSTATPGNIQRGIFQFQSIGCCDPVATKIIFEKPMEEPPQIILTTRAVEFDSGPIEYFFSINDISEKGCQVQLTVPIGVIRMVILEYIAINSDEVEMGFFNIDALGTLHTQTTGDATVPLFMRFRRHFIDEPLVQLFLVGFETQSKAVSFEVTPFSVAQNGVTIKVNKYGPTTLSRLQLSYVACEQPADLAKAVTHTGAKTAQVGFEFLEIGQDKNDQFNIPQVDKSIELVQLAGINGIRFLQPPIAFIWQGDKIEPTALNVNLRITLDRGNQAVLGLYYFEQKKFRKCPKIFSECGYKGSYAYLCKNVPDFERVFKQAKSVMIPNKASITVYQETSFVGVRQQITQNQECIQDWFINVPQGSDIKTMLQLERYRKHQFQNDVLFLQRTHPRDIESDTSEEDFWLKEKEQQGVKMPQWTSWNNEDIQIEKIPEGQQFQKIEDPNTKITIESIGNSKEENFFDEIQDQQEFQLFGKYNQNSNFIPNDE